MMISPSGHFSPTFPSPSQFFSREKKKTTKTKPETKAKLSRLTKFLWIYRQSIQHLMDLIPQQLKAVTLTHVRYRPGDQLGHFLAWISLVPVFISLGGFVSHFLFRRELQGTFFGIGLVISQFINEFIKTSVEQARPETCTLLEACDSHGWPSSHSQFMFFFATYFSLMGCKGIGFWFGLKSRWILNLLHWSLAVVTMYSRVYLGYHTVAQVFAGATLGTVVGASWFWVVNSVLYPYFPVIEESALGRWLCVKDTSHIPDVLKFEYDNARAARKNMDSAKSE